MVDEAERPTNWLPAMAPLPVMLAGLLTVLLLIALATWLLLRQPWLGLDLSPAGDDGLLIEAVDPLAPLTTELVPGQTLVALLATDGRRLELAGYDPGYEPHSESTFAGYNAYLARQGALAAALERDGTQLLTGGGESVPIVWAPARPPGTLSLDYWLFHLFGALAALISLAVWAFRRGQPAARLLALSGVGFFAATWSNSLYLEREMALAEGLFRALSHFNHWALALMLAGLLALLLHYPRRLTSFPVAIPVLGLTVLYQINEGLQLIQWPLHTYYLPIAIFYLLACLAAVRQWQLSRSQPLDRAALHWVLLSVFISMSFAFITYFAPLMVRDEPLLPQSGMVGLAVTLYLGFAGGVLRYRLFDLERWWFVAWGWFLGGLLVLLVDLILVVLFGLQPLHALGLAVVLVGWVYFPVRQWLWQRLAGSSGSRMEDQLPDLVAALFTNAGSEAAEAVWREVLSSHFRPLDLQPEWASLTEPRLEESGAVLRLPGLEPGRVWRLRYPQGGRRLFTRQDCEQGAALLAVAHRVSAVAVAKEAGARTERQRIARDLHDDVAGRLLNLVHRAADEAAEQRARGAMEALRGAITALRDPQPTSLTETLADWCEETRARTEGAGVELQWHTRPDGDVMLSSRQAINLGRILSEAVSNALRHAEPSRIQVEWGLHDGVLTVLVDNDGCVEGALESLPLEGRGQYNMLTRALELRGHLEQGPASHGGHYRVEGRFPVELPPVSLELGCPPK